MTSVEVNDDLEFRTELRQIFGPAGFEIWKKYYMEFSDFWKFCQCGCDQICKTGEHLKEPRRQMMQQFVHEFYPGQNVKVNADATRLVFNATPLVDSEKAIAEAKKLKAMMLEQQELFSRQIAIAQSGKPEQVQRLEALLADTQASTQAEISEFRSRLEANKDQEIGAMAAQMQEVIARAEAKSRELEQAIKHARNSEAQVKEFAPKPIELPAIAKTQSVENAVYQAPIQPQPAQVQPINIPWKALATLGLIAGLVYAVPPAVESIASRVEEAHKNIRVANLEKKINLLNGEIQEMKLEAQADMAACQASYESSLDSIEAIADQVNDLSSQKARLTK